MIGRRFGWSEKEMLSPDVPEFVPRNLQNLDLPSNTEILSQDVGLEVPTAFSPVSNPIPHPYSLPYNSVNDGYCNWNSYHVHPQPWRETSPMCNVFQSQHNAYSYNYAAQPDDNWRYGGYNHWNASSPLPEENNRREGWRKKSNGRFDEDRSLGKQKSVLEKGRLNSGDRISEHHQRSQNGSFRKRKVLKENYNYNQNMKPSFLSESKTCAETSRPIENYNKQKTEVQKNWLHSENSRSGSGCRESGQGGRKGKDNGMEGNVNSVKSGEGDYVKGRGLTLETQGYQSRNNVSYKKILNRRKNHESMTEKTESVISMIPIQSDDQWPTLSGAPCVTSVDERCSSVWGKKDNQPAEQVVWPRPSSVDTSTNASLNSQEIKCVVDKVCGLTEVSDDLIGKDKQGNLQPPRISKDGMTDTKERQFTVAVRPKEGRVWRKEKKDHTVLTKHDGTTPFNVENTYKAPKERKNKESNLNHSTKAFEKSFKNERVSKTDLQKSDLDKFYDIEKEHGVPSSVDKTEVKPFKGDNSFETEKGFTREEAVDTSAWHVQKKKRPKAREQQDDSPSYAKITMAGNRKITSTGSDMSSKRHLEYQRSFESKDTMANSSNKVKGKINPGKTKENKNKDMAGAKDSIQTNKNSAANNRKDALKNYNFDKKLDITSDVVTQNSSNNSSSPTTTKLEASQVLSKSVSVKEKDAKEDETIIKLREERKAKKKQEKMRKRESKLKNAQAVLASDTKVTLISKDVLELLYHDKSQRKTSKPQRTSVNEISKKKSLNSGDRSFQMSSEDYPSLMTVEPKVPKGIESFAESGFGNSVQEDPETCHPVDNFHFSSDPNSVLKNQNALKAKQIKHPKENQNLVSKAKTFRIQEQLESPASEPAVPSYSKALLSAPKSKVVQKAPAEIVVVKKSVAPKKKVKTKDDITFDLLAAVTMKKVRRKDRTLGNVMNILDRQTGKGDGMKVDLFSATSKNSKIIKSKDRQLAGPDSRKFAKSEVVVKRGKQREGQKKKKLTTLKKAMKRAKQMEIENLISVLQEAKKLQELSSSTPVNDGGSVLFPLPSGSVACLPYSGNEISVSEMSLNNNVSRTDNVSAIETNTEISCDSKPTGCANVNNGKMYTRVITDCDSENTEPDERSLEEHSNLSSMPVSKCDNGIDPEFSKKCSEIAEELRKLENPLHKNKFREYCNHIITPEVNAAAKELIQTLVGFQTRHYQRDPVKARIRRRYVCGLRSTTKAMGKLACVIVAPDIARSKGPGALDEVVSNMLSHAKEHGIPIVFALTCRKIGNFCKKNVPVSCIGIINYQGSQDIFHRLMELIPEVQKQYQELVARRGCDGPVTDGEFSDEEFASRTEVCVPALQDSRIVPSSDIGLDAHKINEDASLATNFGTREAVIASTVAILVGKGDEVCAVAHT